MQCKYSNVLAIQHGINAALIAEYIYSKKSKATIHDDMLWTRMTYKQVTAAFPFLGKGAVKNALGKLIYDGILIREKQRSRCFDQAYFYSVTDYGEKIIRSDTADDY